MPESISNRVSEESESFPPWASIEAGDLKDAYDRAVAAMARYQMRAALLAIRLDAAERALKWAQHDLGVANLGLDHQTLNERGPGPMLSDGFIDSLRTWREMTDDA